MNERIHGFIKSFKTVNAKGKSIMSELLNILRDIRSGALPVDEIPRFIAWSLGKRPWLWFAVAITLVVLIIR